MSFKWRTMSLIFAFLLYYCPVVWVQATVVTKKCALLLDNQKNNFSSVTEHRNWLQGTRSLTCNRKNLDLCPEKVLRYVYDSLKNTCVSLFMKKINTPQKNFLTYEECRLVCMETQRY